MKKPFLFFNKGFFIPEGIEVNGNFVSEKEGGIAGIINGDVKIKARLTVEKKGIINGDLYAKDIIVKGKVNGNIFCEGRISTLKDAIVSGNIFAAEARIDKFSIVKGVISHLNQKKNGSNTSMDNMLQKDSMPEIPENIIPDELPQSWF